MLSNAFHLKFAHKTIDITGGIYKQLRHVPGIDSLQLPCSNSGTVPELGPWYDRLHGRILGPVLPVLF